MGGSPLFMMGVSIDQSKVVVVTQANGGSGSNQMDLFSTYNLASSSGSPVPLVDAPGSFAIGPVTGRYYLGLPKEFDVYDPSSLKPVSGSPVPIGTAYVIGISNDETLLYTLSLNTVGPSFVLSAFDPSTLKPKTQLALGIGFNVYTEKYQGEPYAALGVSPDNALLFCIGYVVNKGYSQFSVYDAQTLQELPWSPIQSGSFVPVDFVLSPDGSRLYVLASLSTDGTISLYAVDPIFV